jgi:hypothetical protein
MTQETHPPLLERQLTGHQPVLAALAAVLAWNVLALAGWMVYIVASTRQDPDWGDLVMIVGAMMGVGAFCVSLLIGGAVVAVMNRRGRWRETGVPVGRAIRRGTIAAAAVLAPFLIYAVVGLLVV